MRNVLFRCVLGPLVALLAACSPQSTPTTSNAPPPPTPTPLEVLPKTEVPPPVFAPPEGDVADLAKAIDAFAVDLQRATGGTPGNVVISPASIAAALSMTYAGARGATAEELAKALHVDAVAATKLHDDWQSLLAAWTTPDPKGATLRVANRLFGAKGYAFDPAFVDVTRDRYGAPIEPLDFDDPEPARATINAWVAAQTADRIASLLSPGSVTTQSKLVLVDAMHFQGTWEEPFDKGATAPATFHAPGGDVQAPTMHRTVHLRYAESADAQTVALPFVASHDAKSKLELDVVLPKAGASITSVEPEYGALLSTLDGATWSSVQLALPKFSTKTQLDLASTLQSLGVVRLFDPDRADLSGISSEKPPLYVSSVVHEATLAVDENGSEAAAATAIVLKCGAAATTPVPVTVDRPFGVVLRDRTSGAILFVARIVDPTR